MATAVLAKSPFTWRPMTLTSNPYAVILLNQPIKIQLSIFHKLWDRASFRISVDGGTNQLYNVQQNSQDLRVPDLITGDFDSISPHVKSHYVALGSRTVETPDQNFTDFTKAIMEYFSGIELQSYPKVDSILVIVEPSGRYDQFFANISTLCKFRCSRIPVFLVSEESILWLMPQGHHEVIVDENYANGNASCGVIPIDGRTVMTSTGLKWNLDETMNCSFEHDGIVSTSNEISSSLIEIQTNRDVIWTMKSFFE